MASSCKFHQLWARTVEPLSVNKAPECDFCGWEGSFVRWVSGWAESTEGLDYTESIRNHETLLGRKGLKNPRLFQSKEAKASAAMRTAYQSLKRCLQTCAWLCR